MPFFFFTSLLRGGHGEGDALSRRLLPLLRDRLDLGEELHARLAVEIQVSCKGGFAAGEGEERQRYWNRHVDAHLASFNVCLKFPCRHTRCCKYGCSIAIFVSVHNLDIII